MESGEGVVARGGVTWLPPENFEAKAGVLEKKKESEMFGLHFLCKHTKVCSHLPSDGIVGSKDPPKPAL